MAVFFILMVAKKKKEVLISATGHGLPGKPWDIVYLQFLVSKPLIKFAI